MSRASSKPILVILFGVLLAAASVSASQDMQGREMVVTVGPAAVHLDPSPSSPLVGTVTIGTRVLVEQQRPGWYRVRLPKPDAALAAVYGWIPIEMVAPAPALAPTSTAQPADESMYTVLRDLKAQRDRLDRAIQVLQNTPDGDVHFERGEKESTLPSERSNKATSIPRPPLPRALRRHRVAGSPPGSPVKWPRRVATSLRLLAGSVAGST